MPLPVVAGATLKCAFGLSPSAFLPTPGTVMTQGRPMGTIRHHLPVVNITPFGMCKSPGNPMVVAASLAAGQPTMVPCVPNTQAPWLPGQPTTLVGGVPLLTQTSTCLCLWGGVITVDNPGTTVVETG